MSWIDDAFNNGNNNSNSSNWIDNAFSGTSQPSYDNYYPDESPSPVGDGGTPSPAELPTEEQTPKTPEYSVQQTAQQANGGKNFIDTAMEEVTETQQPEKPELQQRYEDANIFQKAGMLAKGIDRQAGNQFLSAISGTAASLLGEGTMADKIFDAVGNAINKLGGNVDTDKNVFTDWNEARRAREQSDAEAYAQMTSGDKVSGAINKYGTMVWTQAPSAVLSIMMAPVSAAGAASTASLQYTSALAQSSGMQKLATMAMHGLKDQISNPQFWLGYSREAGSAYNTAIDEGASPEAAGLYSMLYGTFSSIIESGGVDENLGGMENFPKAVQDAVKNHDARSAAVEFGKSLLGEIGEELQQGSLENILKMGYRDDIPLYSTENQNAIINPNQMLETARDTAITTALMQGGQHMAMRGINAVQNRVNNAANTQQAEATADQTAKPSTTSQMIDDAFSQGTSEQQTPAKPSVPVPVTDESQFENRQENTQTQPPQVQETPASEITPPTQQESAQAQNEELNSNSVAENGITPEMEAAERAANAAEPAPNGVEETLQRAQERTEAAQQKAQEQKANQPAQEEPQRRKIKPITENEKILSKDRTRLERENKSLRRRVENLSKQTKRTDVKTARESDVKKLANDIVGDSEADRSEVTTKLQTLADYLVQHTGETIDYSEVQRMAEDIASDIVDNTYTNAESGAKEIHDELTKLIRSNTVNFGQLSAQYSMEDAKSNFPGMKFSNTKGMSIQEFYELCVSRGLVEENVVGSHEQLQAIQDSLRGTEDRQVKTFQDDADFDQAVLELQNDIIDRLLGDEVRESEPTFADKQQAKYDAMKSKLTQEVQAEREQRKADRAESRQRMEELRRDAAQRRREAVAKEKAEKYKSNQKIQEHYKNLIERKENRRKTAAQRKKIKDLWNDLSRRVTKPTEGKYIPKELMNATIDLLQSIDTDTGSVSSAEKLNALRSAFNEVKAKPEYANILNDDVHQAMLDSLYETIGGTPLNEMSSDQLTRVHDALKALNHEIKDGVKVKLRNEERQASEVHSQMMEESKNAKGWGKGALGRMNAWYTGAFSRATTYFERLGGFKKDSAWSQMAQRLDEGQLKATNEKVRAARKFNDLLTDKESKTLRDTVKLGKDANGNDIEVSRGMMLSLKMLLDSKDGARHIKYGGVTIPGITDYYKGKNDSGFGTSQSRALGISPELANAQAEYRKLAAEYKRIDAETDKANADWQRRIDDVVARMDEKQAEIDAIYGKGDSYIDTLKGEIEKQLTDYDKKWLKTAREYFNEAQQMLNETTMEVYGFEKANVSDYFPLVTDPNFRKASFESVSRDMSLENSGFMKERTNAANPIMLLDISEVVANYSDKVANYTGIMPAVRDFQKVYGKSEEGFKGSLQNTLDTKFGKDASKYIEDLMADLQGARHSQNDGLGKLLSAARGNMAQAVLTLNPRVAFSQSASYMNAASEIGWKPLMDAMSMGKNPMSDTKVMDLITKYSPLEYYRTLGNANAAMSDIQADAKWQNQMLKKFDWAMGWINMVDQHTVGRLWYASEAYVQQQGTDYAKGTDEYYQEVAKVFNRVVERTQPNYTTMQRAGILRNPNELVKSMTMFMTQRLQNQNILYEAGERFAKYQSDYRDGKNGVTEADVKQARTDLTRAVTSQIASTASLVAMKAGIDAIMHSMRGYRDDDDELNAKSIAAALASNFADSFVGNFLGATELYNTYRSLFRGASYNGVTISGIDTINTTLKDIVSASNAKTEKQLEKWGTVAKDMAQLFGIPLANAQKFVDGARKWAEDIANGEFGTFESDSNRSYLEVDFGYQPITNMFSPAINRLTQSKESRAVESEIERLYKETGIKGVHPSIRGTDSLTIDGEEYVLEGKELDKYHETAGKTAERFANEIINSKAYKALTDEQKAEALRTAYSYAKDLAKDEYIDAHGIETESYTTATGLLKGIDKPGGSNDRTALDEKNLGNYITYMSALKSNISAGDFSSIDKQIGWFSGMDKNLQTVLQERSSDIERLLNYHDIGEGSETYFKVKESIVQSQINLDQSANTSAYVRLYAVADADIPESSKRKIVKDLMQGDSNFIGSHGRAAYNALESYGFTVGQTAQFFDIALHCKTWKDSGDAVDVNGQITADCLAFALQQLPGLSEGERSNIYNAVKNSVVNKFNEDNWAYKNGKQYTYKSEVDWLTNPKNKASYSTGVKISDKGSHQTSDALWAAYLSAS